MWTDRVFGKNRIHCEGQFPIDGHSVRVFRLERDRHPNQMPLTGSGCSSMSDPDPRQAFSATMAQSSANGGERECLIRGSY